MLNLLRKLLFRHIGTKDIDENMKLVLYDLKACLSKSKPRFISPIAASKPILIFTDGACEPSDGNRPKTTCGAVLIDPNTPHAQCCTQIFGFDVRQDLVDRWLASGKQQLVTEAELYAVIAAIHTWSHVIKNRRVLIFVDSEPAMFSLIRGTSNIDTCAELVHEYIRVQYDLQSFVWFVRIPSKSNPADDPSRLHLNEAAENYKASIIEAVQPFIPDLSVPLFAFDERGEKGKQAFQ